MANYTDDNYAEVDALFNNLKESPFETLPQPPAQTESPVGPIGWVENADADDGEATVVIDSDGLHVYDGKITIEDAGGNAVLNSAGFGGSWTDFLSTRFYNGFFRAGTVGSLPATEVSGGDSAADYAASISPELPYWIVRSGTGLSYVVDTDAPYGHAIEVSGASSNGEIYQDAPVVPGTGYSVVIRWRWDAPGAEDFDVDVDMSWRNSDHGLISSAGTFLIHTADTQATYIEDVVRMSGVAPTNAVYLRVEINPAATSGAPDVWIAGVALVESEFIGDKTFTDDVSIEGDLNVDGTLDGEGANFGGTVGAVGLNLGSGAVARYVPLAAISTPLNFPTTAVSVGTTDLECTAVPSSGVVAVQCLLFFKGTIADSGANFFTVIGYQEDQSTAQNSYCAILYAASTGAYNTLQAIVTTGGTNNRSIKYAVDRATGTLTYALRVVGYWTTE